MPSRKGTWKLLTRLPRTGTPPTTPPTADVAKQTGLRTFETAVNNPPRWYLPAWVWRHCHKSQAGLLPVTFWSIDCNQPWVQNRQSAISWSERLGYGRGGCHGFCCGCCCCVGHPFWAATDDARQRAAMGRREICILYVWTVRNQVSVWNMIMGWRSTCWFLRWWCLWWLLSGWWEPLGGPDKTLCTLFIRIGISPRTSSNPLFCFFSPHPKYHYL